MHQPGQISSAGDARVALAACGSAPTAFPATTGTTAAGSASAAANTSVSGGTSTASPTTGGTAAAGSVSAAVQNSTIARQDFSVDFDDFQARAQLTYPASSAGPFPTVILIPGSGPYDMDFTINDFLTGTEKSHIFRDIAEYLSNNGYAVVRYNKHYINGPRDQSDPTAAQNFNRKFTLKQLLTDADKVYQTARENPKVDRNRVVLYGWSEGTTMATQLALMHPEIAGLILQSPVDGTWAETFRYQQLTLGVGFLRDIADANKDCGISAEEVLAAYRSSPGTAAGIALLISLDMNSLAPATAAPGATPPPPTPKVDPKVDKNNDGKLAIAGEVVPFYTEYFSNFDTNAANGPFAPYTSDKALPTIVSAIGGYKGPVLTLQGTNDANVDPAGARRIDDALAAGNRDHTLTTYAGFGHSLARVGTVYLDNFQSIDMQPLKETVAWLDARLKR